MKASVVAGGLKQGQPSSSSIESKASKIVVPIPVHVNRFAVRSQHQQLEKSGFKQPVNNLLPLQQAMGGANFIHAGGLSSFQSVKSGQCGILPPQSFYRNGIKFP